jgi:signal transduction histidine kinase
MRERAAGIGAVVDIHSAPDAGTRVILTVPQHAAAA